MPRRRPSRALPLPALAVGACLALPLLVLGAAWAALNVGTVIALLLALVVFVPPFVLFWGETRGAPSVWGWGGAPDLDADLRRLLEEEGP